MYEDRRIIAQLDDEVTRTVDDEVIGRDEHDGNVHLCTDLSFGIRYGDDGDARTRTIPETGIAMRAVGETCVTDHTLPHRALMMQRAVGGVDAPRTDDASHLRGGTDGGESEDGQT